MFFGIFWKWLKTDCSWTETRHNLPSTSSAQHFRDFVVQLQLELRHLPPKHQAFCELFALVPKGHCCFNLSCFKIFHLPLKFSALPSRTLTQIKKTKDGKRLRNVVVCPLSNNVIWEGPVGCSETFISIPLIMARKNSKEKNQTRNLSKVQAYYFCLLQSVDIQSAIKPSHLNIISIHQQCFMFLFHPDR